MQTILGAGGAISNELAINLQDYTDKIKLVSRNPVRVNETDILFQGDLTNLKSVMEAVNGSDVTYLTVGLKYSLKVWKALWPLIMSNTIQACKEYGSKLVFLITYTCMAKLKEKWSKILQIIHAVKRGKLELESPIC